MLRQLAVAADWPEYGEIVGSLYPFRDVWWIVALMFFAVLVVGGVWIAFSEREPFWVAGLALVGLVGGGLAGAFLYTTRAKTDDLHAVAASLAGPLDETMPGWTVVDPGTGQGNVRLGAKGVSGGFTADDGTVRFVAVDPDGGLHTCTLTYPESVAVIGPDGASDEVPTVPETRLTCVPKDRG